MKALKKILKVLLITIISFVVLFGIYFVYVLLAYYRLDDNLALDVVTTTDSFKVCTTGEEYTIGSYNIGFGAYTPEYSFFMNGGKYSWAMSEEGLHENIDCIAGEIMSLEPDIMLIQEVDFGGTRTYHFDERARLEEMLDPGSFVFAQNYDSPYLFWPIYQPHGANKSGILTYAQFQITSSLRRSLPISESFSKLVDLDRCYSISRIPVDNGHELIIINIHMSAYGSSPAIREGQIGMLVDDIQREYEAGNYVIVGGDYNHNLRDEIDPNAPGWAQRFPRESLPQGFALGFDICEGECDITHNTGRASEEPFDPDTTYTVTLDGFIVSDNITVTGYRTVDTGFIFSDHDPVVMEFVLE
ncbi:Metal-dependent hydrolase, endonuclease/exonuclease/phosphatase family [Oscillospiraceae bacterium]|nr:Metal-dependent hydrolase, endonuclease/exonuclease/phosphatase family [Oscillospiraceae bacterium]